ncbi:hypothetical protein RD110_02570 [Rhodoferax koreense]|uniref:Uncharacterized protein n=2 Tax=Rhodoferax koreensis TaxID=1842727 RepID=A0A1P8JR47_9BURK|nr:hypothetical protein RD110_02570 [Rhodoferax koreense]
MLLLIAVWIFLMKKGGAMSYKQHVTEMKQLGEAQLAEMKRTNDALVRIESLLRQDCGGGRRNTGDEGNLSGQQVAPADGFTAR